MTNLLIDVVLAFWMLLFGGMALLPILTGGRSHAVQEPEDRVIDISPARRVPAARIGARLPLTHGGNHHDRPAA